MKLYTFETQLNFSSDRVFHWHEQPGAFERLIPPFSPLSDVHAPPMQAGKQISFRKFALAFHANITASKPPHSFCDAAYLGPFKLWRHEHLFKSIGPKEMRLVDQIETHLPRKLFERLFNYRAQTLRNDLCIAQALPSTPLRIAITGASGFVGSALVHFLKTLGHTPVEISRKKGKGIYWDPMRGEIDAAALEGIDALIHLAGENIGSLRWSKQKKEAILKSRHQSLQLLLTTLDQMKAPPSRLLITSAVGYFGDQKDERLTSKSAAGSDFLAGVCEKVEALAQQAPVPTTIMRFGIVLSPSGGMLKKLMLPTRLGLGAVIGGDQYISWIALDDLLYQIYALLTNEALTGTFNCTSPHPVTQRTLMKTLAKTMGSPLFLKMPQALVRAACGEASALLLNSIRAVPSKSQLPYFKFPHLESALSHLLGRLSQTPKEHA